MEIKERLMALFNRILGKTKPLIMSRVTSKLDEVVAEASDRVNGRDELSDKEKEVIISIVQDIRSELEVVIAEQLK